MTAVIGPPPPTHDRVIGAAERLVVLSGQDRLSDTQAADALRHVRDMLLHVSDCEGLSIMVERFPEPVPSHARKSTPFEKAVG